MKRVFIPLLMTTKIYAACAEVESYFDTSILKPLMHNTIEHKDDPIDPIFRSDFFFHFFEGSARTESGESTVYALLMKQVQEKLPQLNGIEKDQFRFYLTIYPIIHDTYLAVRDRNHDAVSRYYKKIVEQYPRWMELFR